ncbi:MAG: phosphatase PAP2 family protein [Epsilonproteobacteria bacterium]|nr:phosphatase PAP2 family protein [Campylobacterota bacterium]
MTINRQILITFLLLLTTILFFQFTNIDILLQNHFYNFTTHKWLIDRNEPVLKFIFYDGIKKLLIIFAVSILFSLIFFRKKRVIKEYKKGLILVVFAAILIPVIVGALKDTTNTPCPKNIEYFGGVYPDIKVLDSYPKTFKQKGKIKCWPAGHASGGFALFSLFFLFKTEKNRKRALAVALFVGWSMSLYKMFIGDHFLSHSIITMEIAWLIVLILEKQLTNLFRKRAKNYKYDYYL